MGARLSEPRTDTRAIGNSERRAQDPVVGLDAAAEDSKVQPPLVLEPKARSLRLAEERAAHRNLLMFVAVPRDPCAAATAAVQWAR
jgi:hypothetical protein